MGNIEHVTISASDILALGREQAANDNAEFGGAIVGKKRGNRLKVGRIIPMGMGSKPDPDHFEISPQLAAETSKIIQATGEECFGIAHTHGPKIPNSGPSSADLVEAKKHDICLVVKVNEKGGGQVTFFDKKTSYIPFSIEGVDGRTYHSATPGTMFPPSCWGMAA